VAAAHGALVTERATSRRGVDSAPRRPAAHEQTGCQTLSSKCSRIEQQGYGFDDVQQRRSSCLRAR